MAQYLMVVETYLRFGVLSVMRGYLSRVTKLVGKNG